MSDILLMLAYDLIEKRKDLSLFDAMELIATSNYDEIEEMIKKGE